ncbi:MAG: FeoA family protein [Candidatus Syntropharchaeales archaeon]
MVSMNMNLINLKPDEWARIIAIDAGRGLRERLQMSGISEGCSVRVVSSHGPVTLEVNRHLVSIGRGIAQKIRVVRSE